MKKILIIVFIALLLLLGSIYIFIPDKIKIGSVTKSSLNITAATRYLVNSENWAEWWPGVKPLQYNNIDFKIAKKKLNSFEIQLLYKRDTLFSTLEIISLDSNATAYSWRCEIEGNNNPITRCAQYFKAIHIKKSLDLLLQSLKNYLDKEENVYGFNVHLVKVTDSVLIATKHSFNHEPDIKEIDLMVQQLNDYIIKEKAVSKNFPMLNVHQLGENNYEAMVAIATDRQLATTKDFTPKLVLKGGNILEAEVKGGPFTIKKAFGEFENYKTERGIVSPAIPYQLMITDRMKEKDTTRWITKFYYPIF